MDRPDAVEPPPAAQSPHRSLVGFRLVTAETPTGPAGPWTASGTIEFGITGNPHRCPEIFEAAFDSGAAALVAQVYGDAAVCVPTPAAATEGRELPVGDVRFRSPRLPVTVRLRHSHVAGDIGLLVVDWSVGGRGPDGEPVSASGTATDVARRGPDGFWRYAITDPFGAAP
ncbi:YybH family protein [Yinghuangia soli]|uniref:DUF4440 domain-containing protein n=1 Tax=Yinghuangia soli TaxID=2908204 RepID=A0AA41U407_9ACTN|nr:DUF4440 domain-containing protein [Yinghuangia soli]MCF2532366.1 DUF4440 domain-containing protein [Yinghuangia soli]